MSLDAELDQWRAAWQAQATVPPGLRRRAERQSRQIRCLLAADIAVTVGIGGWVLALAARRPRADMVLLAAVTWLFLAIAWTFRYCNSRGLWSATAANTSEFVDLLARGCRAKIAAAEFGAVLYACEIAFCLGWIYRHESPRPPLGEWLFFGSLFIDCIWLGSAAILFLLAWYRRRKKAELSWLLTLRDL